MQRCGASFLCRCVEAALPAHAAQSSLAALPQGLTPSKCSYTLVNSTLCLAPEYNLIRRKRIQISLKDRPRHPPVVLQRTDFGSVLGFAHGLQLSDRPAAADPCTTVFVSNSEAYVHVRRSVRLRTFFIWAKNTRALQCLCLLHRHYITCAFPRMRLFRERPDL